MTMVGPEAPGTEVLYPPWASEAERKANFIRRVEPLAKKYSAQTGIPPEVYIAWGASETNYGKAGSIFGIKGASPSGKSETYRTHEVVNGRRVEMDDQFAVYDSDEEAFQHLHDLLSSPRYRQAFDYVRQTKDAGGFLRMINDAGYATDPNWADNVVDMANTIGKGGIKHGPLAGPGAPGRPVLGNEVTTLSSEAPTVSGEEVMRRVREARQQREAINQQAVQRSQVRPPDTGEEGLADEDPVAKKLAGWFQQPQQYASVGGDLIPLDPLGKPVKPKPSLLDKVVGAGTDVVGAVTEPFGNIPLFGLPRTGPGGRPVSGPSATSGTPLPYSDKYVPAAGAVGEFVGGGPNEAFGLGMENPEAKRIGRAVAESVVPATYGDAALTLAGAGLAGGPIEALTGVPVEDLGRAARGLGRGLTKVRPTIGGLDAEVLARGAYDEAAVRAATSRRFAENAPPSMFRHERAGANIAAEAAGLEPYETLSNRINRVAREQGVSPGPATRSEFSEVDPATGRRTTRVVERPAPDLSRFRSEAETRGATLNPLSRRAREERAAGREARRGGAQTGAVTQPAGGNAMGKTAQERRYSAQVKKQYEDELVERTIAANPRWAPEQVMAKVDADIAKVEANLQATGMTWGDFADMNRGAQAGATRRTPTPSWEQRPADVAAEVSKKLKVGPDGKVPIEDVKKAIRDSVNAVRAEREGRGTRAAMESASRRSGARAGSDAGSETAGGWTLKRSDGSEKDLGEITGAPTQRGIRARAEEGEAAQRKLNSQMAGDRAAGGMARANAAVEQLRREGRWQSFTDAQLRRERAELRRRAGNLPERSAQRLQLQQEIDTIDNMLERRASGGGQPRRYREAGRGFTNQAGETRGEGGETLYHGMRQPFEGPLEIRPGNNSTIFGNEPVDRQAIFLSTSPDLARDYAPGGGMAEARLSPRAKVLDVRNPTEATEQALEAAGLNPRMLYSANPIWEQLDDPGVVEALRKAGYDAMRFSEEGPSGVVGDTVAVFNPRSLTRTGGAARSGDAQVFARIADRFDTDVRRGGAREGGVQGGNVGGGRATSSQPYFDSSKQRGIDKKTLDNFELEAAPEGEPKSIHYNAVPEDQGKRTVLVNNDPNLENRPGAVPKHGSPVSAGGLTFGAVKDFDTWISELESTLTPAEIKAAGAWYKEVPELLEQAFQQPDPVEFIQAFMVSQVNNSPQGGILNTQRAEDKLSGAVRSKVAGSSKVNEASIMNALMRGSDLRGISVKISDFIDSLLDKSARTWAKDDPRAGRPFVADVWEGRDVGFIDNVVAKYIQEHSGKTLEELGIARDFTGTGATFAPSEQQYEVISRWGNDLTDHLNAQEFMGRSDWTPSEVQAVSWVKVRKQMGAASETTMADSIKANTRRLTAPSLEPAIRDILGEGMELTASEWREATGRYINAMMDSIKGSIPEARYVRAPDAGLDGSHFDVFSSPETAVETAHAIAYHTEGPVVVYRPSNSGKSGHVDIVTEGNLSVQQASAIRDAVVPGVAADVTWEGDNLRLLGVKSKQQQAAAAAAIEDAIPDVRYTLEPGNGDLTVVGDGGTHVDGMEALAKSRRDAADALTDRDTLRAGWAEQALAPFRRGVGEPLPARPAIDEAAIRRGGAREGNLAGAEVGGGRARKGPPEPSDPDVIRAQMAEARRVRDKATAEQIARTERIAARETRREARLEAARAKREAEGKPPIRRRTTPKAATSGQGITPNPALRGASGERLSDRQVRLPNELAGFEPQRGITPSPELANLPGGALRDDPLAAPTQFDAFAPPKTRPSLNPWKNFTGLMGAARSTFSSGDIPLARQGGVLAWFNRKETQRAFKESLKSWRFSEGNAQALRRALETEVDPTDGINYFKHAQEHGLHFREFGFGAAPGSRSPEFDALNDSFISQIVQKNPFLKGSEQAMATFLNRQALDVYKKWAKPMIAARVNDPERYRAVAEVINHAVGHSGGRVAEAASALNFLFSAQYTASRFNILADPFVQWRRGNKEAMRLAGQNIVGLVGGNTALLGLLATTGALTGAWSVGLDPSKPGDLGRIKIGNTRIDTLAGFAPLMSTIAKSYDGARNAKDPGEAFVKIAEATFRYFENKESPWAKVLTEAGLNRRPPNLKDIAVGHIPGVASGVGEAYLNNPSEFSLPAAGLAAPLGAVSVGVNTYRNADDYKRELSGGTYDDLTAVEKLPIMAKVPESAGRDRFKDEKAAYQQALSKAGYVETEKAPKGETPAQKDARDKRNAVTSAKNAQVFRDNPELDVQKWFYGPATGGSVSTVDAADRALALGIENRDVKIEGLPRPLNRDPRVQGIYNAVKGDLVKLDASLRNPENLNRAARELYKKDWKDLNSDQQSTARARITRARQDADPNLDATLAFFGKSNVINPKAKARLDQMIEFAGINAKQDEWLSKVKFAD